MIPSACRPHLIGKGGSNLKALTLKTCTKINVPRSEANKEAAEDEDASAVTPTDEQPVTITGDPAGVALAKKEILDLVAAKVCTHAMHFFINPLKTEGKNRRASCFYV